MGMSGKLLDGDVAIITGAGRGIGAASARLFAEHGARVVVSDRDAEPTEATVESIKAAGGTAIAVPGDVTDPSFAKKIIGAAIDAYGQLNHLVNNAGYTWDGMLHKMSDEQWHAMIEVHNTAPFRLIREASPYMRDKGREEMGKGGPVANRSIVNVSSTSGLHGNTGQINYACAKMGIIGLTKTVAKEWGPFGVRCNAIAFGFIETRLTGSKEAGASMTVGDKEIALGIPEGIRDMAIMFNPMQRAGSPEEAAGGVFFLCSPLAAYVNGHCLEVTGGAGI